MKSAAKAQLPSKQEPRSPESARAADNKNAHTPLPTAPRTNNNMVMSNLIISIIGMIETALRK